MSDAQDSNKDGGLFADDQGGVPQGTPAEEKTGSLSASAASESEPMREDPFEGPMEPLDDPPTEFLSAAPAEEVDYEALAAELDRLEAETAAAAPVAPGQPEGPETKLSDPWFEPAKTTALEPEAPQLTTPAPPAADPVPTVVMDKAPAATEEELPPVFVQAPEAPRKRGNRGAAGLIGLVAAVAFAVLYGGALYLWQMFLDAVPAMVIAPVLDPMDFLTDVLLTAPFWLTVVAFWIAFWLLGVFVNRARWWSWVVLGLLVSLVPYAGFLGGVFIDAPFWKITGSEALTILKNTAFAPMGLVAFILSREVTIWFGAWVSRRGAKMMAEYAAERDEFERNLAEGPAAP